MYTYEESVKLSRLEQESKLAQQPEVKGNVALDPNERKLTELQDMIANSDIFNIEEPIGYCPTCQSCGDSNCCSPDGCKTVICYYGKANMISYYLLQLELEAMREKLLEFVPLDEINEMMDKVEDDFIQDCKKELLNKKTEPTL